MKSSWINGYIFNLRYIPIGIIDIYRNIISPLTLPSCRFYPSCSMYARIAIKKHGVLRGCIMSFIRICKCNPFHPGGYDPID